MLSTEAYTCAIVRMPSTEAHTRALAQMPATQGFLVTVFLFQMGSDLCRGMLSFADGKKLGKSGLFWVKVHLANLFGVNKVSPSRGLLPSRGFLTLHCNKWCPSRGFLNLDCNK